MRVAALLLSCAIGVATPALATSPADPVPAHYHLVVKDTGPDRGALTRDITVVAGGNPVRLERVQSHAFVQSVSGTDDDADDEAGARQEALPDTPAVTPDNAVSTEDADNTGVTAADASPALATSSYHTGLKMGFSQGPAGLVMMATRSVETGQTSLPGGMVAPTLASSHFQYYLKIAEGETKTVRIDKTLTLQVTRLRESH